MADRREKIEALLHSPVTGEREAAQAALDRLGDDKPAYASAEWHAAVLEWCRKLQFCENNLGSRLLSKDEVVLVRNWCRGRGDPWARGAEKIMAIYLKLKAADDVQDQAVEALTDQAGMQWKL